LVATYFCCLDWRGHDLRLAGRGARAAEALTFAVLIGVATIFVWQAVAPARRRPVDQRLSDYVQNDDIVDVAELERPFGKRVLGPSIRSVLRRLGALLPKRNLQKQQRLLVYAGEPGGLTVLDFMGLRLIAAIALGAGCFYFYARQQAAPMMIGATVGAAFVGYLLPWYWVRRRAKQRQNQIRRALPDALDMLTIAVEAGLAFESGLLRVAERWHNALSDEFRRAVGEMHMGITRNVALQRMAARSDVEELGAFVAVLVQSSQLGVSIAQVLHSQAAQMRDIRRQRAEELARQASVKMVLVLVLFFFPIMLIVILGPMFPQLMGVLHGLQRRG
jgi:tight adherence protein C